MQSGETVDKTIRLDKWLKLSRLYKTRAIATRACDDGKVKINNVKSKPARMVKIGDVIIIKAKSKYRTFDVVDIVYKSISNKDARNLYREHEVEMSEESKELFELLQEWDKQGKRKYKGRPTKKERRELDKWREE
ncbi:MAG: S4 domain-containing protein [Calditrichaeota bacterium]|nr:RNA-binding S4 domain-containing protein [candidate division KSB1 bacterium]MCZ6820987.1 S4 domain-containing protein [Calditrichota bacterium]TDI85161.1 MAG: RNA-binding S4 domain-containing protein [Caldithrix sp.]